MNRNFGIASGVIAVGLVALALAAPPAPLADHVYKVNKADTLDVTYTSTLMGSATRTVHASFKKPNMARIESPEMVITADGTTMTTYNKMDNSFMKQDQSAANLAKAFDSLDLQVWQVFFDENALNQLTAVRAAGNITRGGQQMKVVEAMQGRNVIKLFLDRSNVLRQAEIIDNSGTRPVSTLINVTAMSTEAQFGADAFAFTAPSGAKEIDANAYTGEWIIDDLPKAIEMSKATGKIIMIDAMASWCGPCKLMDAQAFQHPKFKELAKDFVLLKVDADIDKGFARKYSIDAFPSVIFVNKEGKEVHRFVGYSSPEQVFGEMKTALSKR